MLNTALVTTGHGYEKSDRGRCTAFDGFEIVANPLGEWSDADRERRVFKGKDGPGVTYGSHVLYLMTRDERGERSFYIGVHHGGGREVWRIPAAFNYLPETVAALVQIEERALYSILRGIVDALDNTKRHAEQETASDWRRATLDKRVKVSRQPTKGRAFVWIEPARAEGETDAQHKMRCAIAKPAGVR